MDFDLNISCLLDDYLQHQMMPFKAADFCRFARKYLSWPSPELVYDFLVTCDKVFPLVGDEFITRAAVFTDRLFTFKPSKEEVDKGFFIIGHRGMPFLNPDFPPDHVNILCGGKKIEPSAQSFSMNLALDTYALFGEGFVLPYIFNDSGNSEYKLSSVQYSLPNKIRLTAWPLSGIAPGGFSYGDRIVCRVADWSENTVEMNVLKGNASRHSVSESDIAREEWYAKVEEELLKGFERNGPVDSIERQLALLYLENLFELCSADSGSIEEFLQRSKKVGLSVYGVENRLWYAGKDVPFCGEWNSGLPTRIYLSNITVEFSQSLVDAFVEDFLYSGDGEFSDEVKQEILDKLFPPELDMPASERRVLLLNIQKRYNILSKDYNSFADFSVASIRKRALELFTQVCALMCGVGCSELELNDFPQQELVILNQLFVHSVRTIEEIENKALLPSVPLDAVEISLFGMEETFLDIKDSLISVLNTAPAKGFEFVD